MGERSTTIGIHVIGPIIRWAHRKHGAEARFGVGVTRGTVPTLRPG